MRISSLVGLLLLAACQAKPIDAVDQSAATTDDGDRIDCARGAAALARVCTVDRTDGGQGLILTIRRPDGAFRRLLVTKDGRGVIAADGAERAVVTIVSPEAIDVAVGGDRYRLPATVKAKPAGS